jgi:hypothetical protein
MNSLRLNCLLILLFVVFMAFGYELSMRKILWADELNTQVLSVENKTWTQLLQGQAREGSNAPLYYLIQKAIISVAGYRLPFSWQTQNDGNIYDRYSQGLVRLSANICMSLSLVLIVRYFLLHVSFGAACLSLIGSLSSYMVWAYWAEARPYALWFLLTTIQLIAFVRFLQTSKRKYLTVLIVTHVLLAFTVILSVGQIVMVSFFVWLNQNKKIDKSLVFMCMPIAACCYYFYVLNYQNSFLIHHYRVFYPFGIIHHAFPLDQMVLLAVFGLIYATSHFIFKIKRDLTIFKIEKALINLTIAGFMFVFVLMAYYKHIEIPEQPYDILDNRYFIFLTPVAIVMLTHFTVGIFRLLRKHCDWRWSVQFIGLVTGFYIVRFLLLYQDIYKKAWFSY